jgi:hypothetical protein
VIPIAAFTSMVHTVSGIVLHRLQRMVNYGRHAVRGALVDRRDGAPGQGVGPELLREGRPGPIERRRCRRSRFPSRRPAAIAIAADFDARLAALVAAARRLAGAEEVVAESVRSMFGLTARECRRRSARSGDEPGAQPLSLDILDVSHHSPLMRSLHHANYVFEKR